MSFTNVYYKRIAGTSRACYICYKPTTTVLATIDTVDFLYTCAVHLTDPGFASRVGETGDGTAASKKLNTEEIEKIKEEWEARQKKKAENAKEKAKTKETNDGETNSDKKEKGEDKQQKESKEKSSPPKSPDRSSGSSTPSTAAHERYTLHRDFFGMRLAEHRKIRQTAQAKELAPRLPGAPHGAPSPSTGSTLG